MCDIGAGDVLIAYPSGSDALHEVVAQTIERASERITIGRRESLRDVHRELTDGGRYPFGHEVLRLQVPEGSEVQSSAELHKWFSWQVLGSAFPEHRSVREGVMRAFAAPEIPFHAAPSSLWSSSGTGPGHAFTLQAAHAAALATVGAATPRTAAGVTIGVLDTGFDSLGRAQTVTGRLNAVDYDDAARRTDVHDGLGHGSLVADLIASVVTDAEYKIVKVFTDSGCSTDWHVLLGISLLYDCDIINMSLESDLGGYSHGGCDQMGHASVSALFEAVMTKALTTNDCIYVAAAGNNSRPALSYPARFGNIIAVKSVNLVNSISAFSSTGTADHQQQDHPHIVAAPGGEFGANVTEEDLALDAAGKGQYGTSFAAAYVSGVLAARLAAARAAGGSSDPASIISDMEATCERDTSWYSIGHGHGIPQAS